MSGAYMYNNRVRIGHWLDNTALEEYKVNELLESIKQGNMMLAKYRIMNDHLNEPVELSTTPNILSYGLRVALYAPYITVGFKNSKGILLGGRLDANSINYTQELVDGCHVVGHAELEPKQKTTFIITAPDYCDREDEQLCYNSKFLLALASSVEKKEPLYLRYDPDPIPSLWGLYPLYLSKNPIFNTAWRVLPVQKPGITRFEREGEIVTINTDVIINHCATNINLAINENGWTTGFNGKVVPPLMKTCVDIHGRDLSNNIWQIKAEMAKEE